MIQFASSCNRPRVKFTIDAVDSWSGARAGTLTTRHAVVPTPVFMPVATQGALRGVTLPVASQLEYPILLANTYHLLLRPGPEVLQQFGGLRKFMKWDHGVLTDSGGFQIFSLARQLQISDEGAVFRSYLDGRSIVLTPERSIEMQRCIGSDIMMVLDQCIDSTSPESVAREALLRTTAWAKRSLRARGDSWQALFGIVQGACFPHLRAESAARITELGFDGYALGGLAVGESKQEREDTVESSAPLLPADKPRYLMGVGTPIDLLEAVRRGMDMFDCILPTSLAHQGVCFTSGGKIDLRRGKYRGSDERLDSDCSCVTCSTHERAYLHHLIKSDEFVADQLLSLHNLTFYRNLMSRMRDAILSGTFQELYHRERSVLERTDAPDPQPVVRKPKQLPILGDYEVVIKHGGAGGIKQRSSGEIMHSVVDPIEEAHQLYVDQAGLEGAVSQEGAPIVIWDVGLGAAANCMAALTAIEKLPGRKRQVRIVSFERDLDPLLLALRNVKHFRYLRHPAPHKLVRYGQWSSADGLFTWELIKGDFRESYREAPVADLIWYDPFSAKVDSDLWSESMFRELLSKLGTQPATLYTYTNSTAIRAALLAAGWWVGKGRGTGPKIETTCAFTPAAASSGGALPLLDSSWLSKWERSDAQCPHGSSINDIRAALRTHPQFGASHDANDSLPGVR